MDSNNYRHYPAIITKTPDNYYCIQLRNWQGAISEAPSYDEAKETAKNLLFDVFDSLLADHQVIAEAVLPKDGDYIIDLSLDTALKIMIQNIMIKKSYKKTDIAKGLNIAPQRMAKFLSFTKSTKLEFLDRAFSFMQTPLKINV
jgi:predicted RNase H-like HicB family nuclease